MNAEQTIDCPDPEVLKQFLQGKLEPPKLNDCESHIGECPSCYETLRGLNSDDTLSSYVAKAMDDLGNADSIAYTDPVHASIQHSDSVEVASLVERLLNPENLRRSSMSPGGAQPVHFSQAEAEMLADRGAEVLRYVTSDGDDSSLGCIGDYRLMKLIGAGSTGVVFHAVDQTLDRSVALKVLRPSLGSIARERFMAEARVAASIEHPNVVTIYQVGQVDRLAFIAMQWLPGQTLEVSLKQDSLMQEDAVRQIASQIASGLVASHQKQLVHRDIKPANIWICEGSGEVKILDFGLARIGDDDPGLTATGMLAGTPNFMSPEQARGLELDGRSDLFSLGCVMYRLTTGRLPFGSTTVLATLQSIQNDQPSPPKTIRPEISAELSDLTMSLLEKQPANRPESAVELVEMLDRQRQDWPRQVNVYENVGSPNALIVAPNHNQIDLQAAPTTNRQAASRISVTTPQNADSGFHIGRWILAGLLALFGFGGAWYAPQIIRIINDEGEIVIQTDDKSVDVEIYQNGERVEIVDTETKQRLNIRSGDYKIQVAASEDGEQRNTYEVTPNKLTMKRGNSTIVTVTKVLPSKRNPNTVAPAGLVQKPAISLEGAVANETIDLERPLFNGQNFNHWFAITQREKNPERICVALDAVVRLAETDDEKSKRYSLVQKWARVYATGRYYRQLEEGLVKQFNKVFRYALRRFDEDEAADFLIDELSSGTSPSQRLCRDYFSYAGFKKGESKLLQATIRKGIPLLEAAIMFSDANFSESNYEFWFWITSLLRSPTPDPGFRNDAGESITSMKVRAANAEVDAINPHLRSWLKAKYLAFDGNLETRRELALLVGFYAEGDRAFFADMLKLLFNRETSPKLRDELFFDVRYQKAGQDSNAIAMLLVLENQLPNRHGNLNSIIPRRWIEEFGFARFDCDRTDKLVFDSIAWNQNDIGESSSEMDGFDDYSIGGGGLAGDEREGLADVIGEPAIVRHAIEGLLEIESEISKEFKEKTLSPVLRKLLADNEDWFSKKDIRQLKIRQSMNHLIELEGHGRDPRSQKKAVSDEEEGEPGLVADSKKNPVAEKEPQAASKQSNPTKQRKPRKTIEEVFNEMHRAANASNGTAFAKFEHPDAGVRINGSRPPIMRRLEPFLGELIWTEASSSPFFRSGHLLAELKRLDGSTAFVKFEFLKKDGEWMYNDDFSPSYRAAAFLEFSPAEGDVKEIIHTHLGGKRHVVWATKDSGKFNLVVRSLKPAKALKLVNEKVDELKASLKSVGLDSYLKVIVPAVEPTLPERKSDKLPGVESKDPAE